LYFQGKLKKGKFYLVLVAGLIIGTKSELSRSINSPAGLWCSRFLKLSKPKSVVWDGIIIGLSLEGSLSRETLTTVRGYWLKKLVGVTTLLAGLMIGGLLWNPECWPKVGCPNVNILCAE